MDWQAYLEAKQTEFLEDLLDFIRIPSISALPENAEAVAQAAEWVARRLEKAGIEHVAVMPTGGHPVVYGDWLHAENGPTVLIYGHFDVQPADPVALWHAPPFEPVIRDGKIFARGASDDKGGMLTPILAVEALLRTDGRLPVNVKFCFEGQEEIGSPQLPAFIREHRDQFACDLVLSADGLLWSVDRPMLVTRYKGLAGIQIDVTGPKQDLHSGLYGGVLQNPLEAISRIITSFRNESGRIAVEGFFDDVIDLSGEERDRIAAVPFDDASYRQSLGIEALFGEPGYSTWERNWTRPTLEINGLWGGFQGEGTKTVIPSTGHAKVTCRLVADQAPERIVDCLIKHVRRHTPPGVRVEVNPLPGRADPYFLPVDHPAHRLAARVLTDLFEGTPPYFVGVGGSVPIIPIFQQVLGAPTINFGWSVGDEQLHAPNEYFRLQNFTRGQRGYCLMLKELAGYGA